MEKKVGIIGFGIMGAAMARRLIDAGFDVFAFDKSTASMSRAREIGCTTAATPAAIAGLAQIVLLSLPRPEHVVAVVCEGDDCLLAGARGGSLIVDTSTVDPATSQQNAKAAMIKNVGYLDCPILGRPSACGNWTLPTGGDPQYIPIAAPVLETFAAKIVHVGPSGHGNMLKLLNNLMFGAINSITCEVFALGERLGMEPALLFDTIANSGAGTVSNLFKELGPKIVEREFIPNFTIDNMEKDVGLGIAMAEQCGMTLDVSQTGQKLNRMAQMAGLGHEDTAAIVKIYEGAQTKGRFSQ
jgi:3-hydroxyisobutyrate dehydrogenase-like beta-hydroxyacid dehydrogenase